MNSYSRSDNVQIEINFNETYEAPIGSPRHVSEIQVDLFKHTCQRHIRRIRSLYRTSYLKNVEYTT